MTTFPDVAPSVQPNLATTPGVQLDFQQAIRQIRVLNITWMRDRLGRELARAVQQVWAAAASGHTLPGMTRDFNDPRVAAAIANPNAVHVQGDGQITISLEHDQLAAQTLARFEDGVAPYDMKPGLLASSTHENAEGGRYQIIPFRHGTPTQTGSALHFATIMPQSVYDVAQTLESDEQIIDEAPPITKSQMGGMTDDYTHKAALYQSMKRYGRKGASRYMTFRTVSETSSDPNSWWNPGQEPGGLVDAVCDEVQNTVVPNIVRHYLGKQSYS